MRGEVLVRHILLVGVILVLINALKPQGIEDVRILCIYVSMCVFAEAHITKNTFLAVTLKNVRIARLLELWKQILKCHVILSINV